MVTFNLIESNEETDEPPLSVENNNSLTIDNYIIAELLDSASVEESDKSDLERVAILFEGYQLEEERSEEETAYLVPEQNTTVESTLDFSKADQEYLFDREEELPILNVRTPDEQDAAGMYHLSMRLFLNMLAHKAMKMSVNAFFNQGYAVAYNN